MASLTIDPTVPADSESPRQGASRIRNNVLQFLGLISQAGGNPVTFSAAPFTVDTNGNVTVNVTLSIPAPTLSLHATTKAYVDSGDANSLSQANAYTNSQISGISLVVPGVQQPTVSTTLLATTIPSQGSASVLQVTSTPPAVPTSAQKFRAMVSCRVFYLVAGVAFPGLQLSLTDTRTLFNNPPGAELVQGGISGTTSQVSLGFTDISDNATTAASGATTFTVKAYNASNASQAVTPKSTGDADVTSLTFLKVAWVPAL